MSKVLIIGNNGGGKTLTDGGSIKIRLYKECLEELGVQVELIDLFGWKKHIFKLFKDIKQGVKNSDSILIMGGPNGARMLIPLVNKYNKKYHKRVVYPLLGIGTFEKLLSHLNDEDTVNFIQGKSTYGIRDDKMKKELQKLDLIIPENDMLSNLYTNFYELNNVKTLYNFRDLPISKRNYKSNKPFRIIYLSRVTHNKGIFLLIDAAKKVEGISLDIYGENQLTDEENKLLNSLLDDKIQYKGKIAPEQSLSLLGEYDLFVLPTMYKGEGTSGSFAESLIAGTPVLLSSYGLAHHLIKDKENGFIFKLGDVDDLVEKLEMIRDSKDLKQISKNGQELAKQYTFEYNKAKFLEYILGK